MLPGLASNSCAQGILLLQASGCWGYRSILHWPHCRVLYSRVLLSRDVMSHVAAGDLEV